MYIPKLEVLFLLKAKAFLDREYRLKRADVTEREYLAHKTWKDAYDVDSLMQKKMDKEVIRSIINEYNVEGIFKGLGRKVRVYL